MARLCDKEMFDSKIERIKIEMEGLQYIYRVELDELLENSQMQFNYKQDTISTVKSVEAHFAKCEGSLKYDKDADEVWPSASIS